MKADFICVFNIKDKKIENVAHKELIENDYLIPANEWCDFLINYDEIIRAIIIDDVSSIYINPLDEPPKAYNEINDCFEMTAICLYKKLKESALKNIDKSSATQHWYISLKTLTYSWHKRKFEGHKRKFEENPELPYNYMVENEFILIKLWEGFVSKRKFGRLISSYADEKRN